MLFPWNEKIKRLGFGCMRLPLLDPNDESSIDIEKTKVMFDLFMERGFSYFDTAHGYHRGASEKAIKEALTKRYPRNSYWLTDKLTSGLFSSHDEIRPYFQKQLELLGVDYLDLYLLHAVNSRNLDFYEKEGCFEECLKLKEEGKIHHLGISFHDHADVLEMILKRHPEIEIVQIQFNYLDYLDVNVQSKKCYDICVKYQKPIIVMEPVKGGILARLPKDAHQIFASLNNGSDASYALRFAASQNQVVMVLSGMSNLEQVKDNTSFMDEGLDLNEKENEAIKNVVAQLRGESLIPCTSCHYCSAGCPKKIMIPELFSDYNNKLRNNGLNSKSSIDDKNYSLHTSDEHGKANSCINCRQCMKVCPQKLEIPTLLKKVSQMFD